MLRAALSLWRGSPMPEVAHLPFAASIIRRLWSLRAAADRELLQAYVEVGRLEEALDLAERLSAGAPDDAELAGAVADLDSAIAYGNSLPFVRSGPVLLLGHSRGGMLAVHYAGLHPDRVLGVINFGGGWMGGPLTVLNMPLFVAAGNAARGRVPQLWLYADNDNFFAMTDVRAQLTAFVRAGGRARVELVHAVPGEGHLLINYPALWQPAAEGFLAELPPS